MSEPYCKAIKGNEYAGLWELSIKFANELSRIFYFVPYYDTLVLLYGIVKESNKTPKRELDMAMKYMSDYERRLNKNE